jgi:hypothetical protein
MFADGTRGLLPGILQRFSTAVAAEEPISPPVQVNYTKLLINGDFVDSASGMYMHVTFLFLFLLPEFFIIVVYFLNYI